MRTKLSMYRLQSEDTFSRRARSGRAAGKLLLRHPMKYGYAPALPPKLLLDLIHHLLPSPGSGLAKQPCRWIPGTILAFQEPAPIAAFIQQDPYGFTHGAGQMRNASVDGNHQVEIGDNRRRVGKILQLRGQIDQAHVRRQLLHLLASRAQL